MQWLGCMAGADAMQQLNGGNRHSHDARVKMILKK
jgi:hypothetical protein